MTHPSSVAEQCESSIGSRQSLIRMDQLANPYGPSLAIGEALAGGSYETERGESRQAELQQRLAHAVRLQPEWVLLANGVDELLGMISLFHRNRGPLVVFPPADLNDVVRARHYNMDVIAIQRSPNFGIDLDVETAAELPSEGLAVVTSPNNPTGNLLSLHEAVRLARSCAIVIIDERHGRYCPGTLLPLVREFDNVVVIQTFETWGGLTGYPIAYALGPPKLLKQIAAYGRPSGVAMSAIVAAMATLDDLAYVGATVRRVRDERSRLYRMLRKLNMLQPYPSWANFLLARVERGTAEDLTAELDRRHIIVHQPPQAELAPFIRISATQPAATDALRRALIAAAAHL